MEMVYFFVIVVMFVIVFVIYMVLIKLVNVMEGILRFVGLLVSCGYDILVVLRIFCGVDKEYKNFM